MDTYDAWLYQKIVDTDGNKVGHVENIYVDTQTHEPRWLHLVTGFFTDKHTFVPLSSVSPSRDETHLVTRYPARFVRGAPHFKVNQVLNTYDEQELYEYYDLSYALYPELAMSDQHQQHQHAQAPAPVHTQEVRKEHLNGSKGRLRLKRYTVIETKEIGLGDDTTQDT